MAPKLTPPFRTEHVGSLLRPDYLLDARRKFGKKEIALDQLREVEDQAIAEAINLQREVGIRGYTDGEYRRRMFHEGFFESLEGFEEIQNPPFELFKQYVPTIRAFAAKNIRPASTMLCTGKIRWVKSGYVPHFEALKKLVHSDEVKNIKVTLATPEWFDLRHAEHAYKQGVYANREDYLNDIATAYRQELDALYAAGCRNVQIDDPLLAYFCDEGMRKDMKAVGKDADALFDEYLRLINNGLATRQGDMRGGYDVIAIRLFNDLNVDCYYLEYDTERAGTFEPLKHLPKHKSLVLGIVTSKFPELEDKAVLRERVFEAARIMASGSGETVDAALQRISISPQCGFASHEEGNLLTVDDMKRKLQLLKDLADSIWVDA